jgi:UDP-glucose 4-epimerase
MKILITGGAGFIGSHLVDACVQKGHDVFIVDNLVTGSQGNILHHEWNPRVQFFHGDICDKNAMEKIFLSASPDAVFHLAAQVNVRHSIEDPHYCFETNILGTTNVLEAMRYSGCTRIIFASTGGVMFSTDTPPYSETDLPSPNTPYWISKHCAEQIIDFYTSQYGFNSTLLRYANVYWPRQDPRWEAGIIAIFLDKIQQKSAPTIFGDGEQTRDFIHVFDVVNANIHVLENDISGLYHVGTGSQTSINTLWNMLRGIVDTDIIPSYGPAIAEPRFVFLSVDKLRATGWSIHHGLEESLRVLAKQ